MSHEERKVAVSNLEQNKEADNNTVDDRNSAEETSAEKKTEAVKSENPEAETSAEIPEQKDADKAETEVEADDVISEEISGSESEETAEAESAEEEVPDEASEPESEQAADTETDAKTEAEDSATTDLNSETADETAGSEDEAQLQNEDSAEEVQPEEDNTDFYKSIAERASELVVQTDWAFVTAELAAMAQNIAESTSPSTEEAKKYLGEFQAHRSGFEEKKKAHYEEVNKKKQENLLRKKELLKTLSEIITSENWSATKEVNQIKNQWENIKLLPQGESESLNERYSALLQEFEDHKVDRLVKKLQKEEENMEVKLLLLDKMDSLNKKLEDETVDFDRLNKEFEDLLAQWRKVGRVPAERNQALWDRYHSSQDAFNERRFKYDKVYRKSIEKSLSKKKKLVKEAEALLDNEDIAEAARKVNKLHKAWKKAGNLPQREENEMWDLFKAATDTFNEKKSENIDQLRQQEDENLEKKMELIQKAEETKDIEDFEAGHQKMQDLMNQWKNIGPVPRKKSSKIWKKFKGEMDDFYERRREGFKEQRQDQKDNLAKKQEILDKLEELGKHEDPALAVEEAKKLQQEFKDIGHVPIKAKNKIWKQYRESCDVIYERFRSLGADLGMEKKLAKAGVEPGSRKDIIKHQKEIKKLKKEVSVLESEIIQYQEAKTYFKPTNRGNVLLDELEEKIGKAENKLEQKQQRLYELDREIDKLSETDTESGESSETGSDNNDS